MKFQVLSHAGLRVNSDGKELICDPWLIGSCYWRSWWNYPPVKTELIESLNPTAIYLTHIHWDHFQGPSLRLFSRDTKIIIPKGNYSRIKHDLNKMGFLNVRELVHGESYNLDEDFKITSYQFGPFLDSGLIIESGGTVFFNANDAKLMGPPLKQICKLHPNIDFVFRSHSSANSRLCYEYMDNSDIPIDHMEQYIENFADFCSAVDAKYAIPFASNHCFLHKDVFDFNETVQTPEMVSAYWQKNNVKHPQLKIMVSGDQWDSKSGFKCDEQDYFRNRDSRLEIYRTEQAEKLSKTYRKEDDAVLKIEQFDNYFRKLCIHTPFIARKFLVGNTDFLYVLNSGNTTYRFAVNLLKKKTWKVDENSVNDFNVQIHTSTEILKQCILLDLFSHLSISKRVKYKVTLASKKRMNGLNLLFNCYEYEILPLRRLFSPRSLYNWALRWREIMLYLVLIKDKAANGKLDQKKYLQRTTSN